MSLFLDSYNQKEVEQNNVDIGPLWTLQRKNLDVSTTNGNINCELSIAANTKSRRYTLGFFSTKPKLTESERVDCLHYLEEEEKLQVFRSKENDLCNAVLSEDNQSRSSDSQVNEKMYRAANRLVKAAEHILKSRAEMKSIPDIASKHYLAWQKVYIDYHTHVAAVSRLWEGKVQGITPNDRDLKKSQFSLKLSLKRANKETDKLLKRLQLNDDELRKMRSEAAAYYEAEKWQPRENESN